MAIKEKQDLNTGQYETFHFARSLDESLASRGTHKQHTGRKRFKKGKHKE